MNTWLKIGVVALLACSMGANAYPVKQPVHPKKHAVHRSSAHKASTRKSSSHKSSSHGKAHAAQPGATARPGEEKVRELFGLMHLDQIFGQMNTRMVDVMAQAVPCVPASYWQGFMDEGSNQQLVARLVPVYQAHFTSADVEGLLKFYRSPLGQKMVAQMPVTMAESMKVGQQWGQERRDQMIQTLQRRGTLDAQGSCPATGPAAAASVRSLPPVSSPTRAATPSGH